MNKIYKHFTWIILLLIFSLALFLRTIKLNSYPVGFHIDEASLGYNGYSILKTGLDESGKFLPLYIDMFGDFRPSGYHFLTVPSIAFFGLTEFATRLPGALFGALSVFAIFFLSYSIFKDKKIALVSALLLAVTPWHYVLSRASAEAIVSLFFIMTGFAFIILSIRTQKVRYIVLGSIISSLSFFFYHTPRVFVPLLFLVLIVVSINTWKKYAGKFKITLLSSFVTVSLLAVILVFGISGGTGRFNQVNVFSSFEANYQLQQSIIEDGKAFSPRILSRAMHNKATNIGYMFVSNYLSYFNGEFLFTSGGLPAWYSIPRIGILHMIILPFLLYGIYLLVQKKGIYYKIPLVWLVVGPIVAATTLDDIPNINRASVMFPMFELIAAFGIISFIDMIPKKRKSLVISAVSLCFAISVSYFLFQYFVNAKTHKPWFRNNGFAQMMGVVNNNYSKTDVIIMSKYQGGIYPLALFYLKFDPKIYQAEGSPKTVDYKNIGKVYFVPQDCPFSQFSNNFPQAKRIIYIENGNCPYDKRLKVMRNEYIYREDGTPAFRIVYDYAD